ncbi:DUF2155 domain-containing protein [Chachezhania antarctica]|uniref:DUF2155 domain-containing protein n=1 Tax=Chachezhania antarctica TaxID=2340860 RepID=UPI003B848E80
MRALVLLLAGLVATPALPQAPSVNAVSGTGAILRGLDKVNGHGMDVELSRGGRAVIFGLDVRLDDCRYPPNNPSGDGFALLTIRRLGDPKVLFEGWMIASSPALNALDDPRYDVWVLRCMIS